MRQTGAARAARIEWYEGRVHSTTSSRARRVALGALLHVALILCSATTHADGPSVAEAQARALEMRLLAPCCWNQTLDIHDSDLARSLHREIVDRLTRAESAEIIEGDIVARYGERIRAVPPSSPLPMVALGTLLCVLLAGVGLWIVALRWRAAGAQASTQDRAAVDTQSDDAYDAQITRELAEH